MIENTWVRVVSSETKHLHQIILGIRWGQEPITRSVQLSYFLATAFSQVELFLDMPFPPKITVSGYVRIEIWVKTMVAKLRCFCYCVPFSTCRFPSFLKLVFSQFHAFYLHFPRVQVKQRHTFDTILSVRVLSIESTLCKFFSRLCNGQGEF